LLDILRLLSECREIQGLKPTSRLDFVPISSLGGHQFLI
jgi:hypothetical protein